MKKILVLVLMLSTSLLSGQVKVELPAHGYNNYRNIEVASVERNDEATMVIVNLYPYHNTPVTVTGQTYLEAGGVKYPVRAATIPDGELRGTQSGGSMLGQQFTRDSTIELTFPPLPHETVTAHLFFSEDKHRFRIYDIDFTPGKKYISQLPQEAANYIPNLDRPLPEPVYKIDKTTITIHFMGYPDGTPDAALNASDIFTGETDQMTGKKNGNSITYTFDQYATSANNLILGRMILPIVTDPGENIDVYFDMPALSHKRSHLRADDNMKYAYFTGKHADLNYEVAHWPVLYNESQINPFLETNHIGLKGKTPEEFMKLVVESYNEKAARIDDDPEKGLLMKQYEKALYGQVNIEVLQFLEMMYRFNDPEAPKPEVSESPELYKLVAGLPVNDQNLFYAQGAPGTWLWLGENTPDPTLPESITGSKDGLLYYGYHIYPILKKARVMEPLTDEEQSRIAGFPEYYQTLYHHIDKTVKEKYEATMASSSFTLCDTPDGDPDNIIDAIVAQYKGKVVFVDLWATWCGPCLAAMRTIQPLKPEMKEHDVVTVYITTTSSPKTKWTLMLPDIGGLHYYLDDDQWQALMDRYGFTGIPSYILFDKEGNFVNKFTGFPGVERMRTELEKIW